MSTINKKKTLFAAAAASIIILAALTLFLTTPSIEFKEGPYYLEAGEAFSPRDLIASISRRPYEQLTVTSFVDENKPGEYLVEYRGGVKKWERTVTVQDTTAPTLILKPDGTTIDAGVSLTADMLIESVSDATGLSDAIGFAFVEGSIDQIGEAVVEVSVEDNYGNSVSDTIKVQVKDGVPPELILKAEVMELLLGEEADVLAMVESVTDNITPSDAIEISYEIEEGDLTHSGETKVLISAKDEHDNKSSRTVTVRVVDNEPPVLVMKDYAAPVLVDNPVSPWDAIASLTDNDGEPEVSFRVISGDINNIGNVTIEVTATDASGNSVSGIGEIYRKPRSYNALGWDVTGIDGQPYLVGVNRATGIVTVYGKDGMGDYNVPVVAFSCSVGRPGCETITGRYNTGERYVWRLMVDGTYGRYAIRINGSYMFHSVPYYAASPDTLEWPEYNKLGSPASLGCIRMKCADIYWLYCNCPAGFPTIIYDGASDPIGANGFMPIDESNEVMRNWDPSDSISPGNPWYG